MVSVIVRQCQSPIQFCRQCRADNFSMGFWNWRTKDTGSHSVYCVLYSKTWQQLLENQLIASLENSRERRGSQKAMARIFHMEFPHFQLQQDEHMQFRTDGIFCILQAYIHLNFRERSENALEFSGSIEKPYVATKLCYFTTYEPAVFVEGFLFGSVGLVMMPLEWTREVSLLLDRAPVCTPQRCVSLSRRCRSFLKRRLLACVGLPPCAESEDHARRCCRHHRSGLEC